MKKHYEIAVIGSGFAGSLMAMIAVRLGHSVILIDKGRHPRFVIGESSTPLANLLLEELTARYDLPALGSLSKWGSWQQHHPDIGCGLKRGFSFYHHDRDRPESFPPNRSRQLLVAASPRDKIADTHWYRADFDTYFVQQARDLGVEYLDETTLTTLHGSNGKVIRGYNSQGEIEVHTSFVIDASGSKGFLHRILNAKELLTADDPKTQALHSHFRGVQRLEEIASAGADQTPYPVDDAAVHHIFEGGWIWVLQFNNGITSAGVVATEKAANDLALAEGEGAWHRLLASIPVLRHQFARSSSIRPFTYMHQVNFHTELTAGADWAMLPSAVGFVDPLLSTGFPLTLLGISRLAGILKDHWGTNHLGTALHNYARLTHDELTVTSKLIAALYKNMHDFPVFSALTMLYFAAASYSETVRRLGSPHLAPSFLLHTHPVFGSAMKRLLERASASRSSAESMEFVAEIQQLIEPFNVAGLCEDSRNNWYPVKASDLLCSAAKVQATEEEVASLLRRCGLSAEASMSIDG